MTMNVANNPEKGEVCLPSQSETFVDGRLSGFACRLLAKLLSKSLELLC